MFVTWTKQGNLRGCIGTFAPQPLIKGVHDFALKRSARHPQIVDTGPYHAQAAPHGIFDYFSAFEDDRFPKIQKSELEKLSCKVSLLTDFEAASHVHDWMVLLWINKYLHSDKLASWLL